MTRYAIDAAVALRLVRAGSDADKRHQLVGPAVLRSHALSMLYQDVREGRLDEKSGRSQLEGLAGMKIRLLGDRVSRATAWRIAATLGWDDTAMAEYLAVGVLQADALVRDDPRLRAGASGLLALPPLSPLDPCAGYCGLFTRHARQRPAAGRRASTSPHSPHPTSSKQAIRRKQADPGHNCLFWANRLFSATRIQPNGQP